MKMKMHRGWMTLVVLLTAGMLISLTGCEPEVKYVEKEVEKIVEKEVEKVVEKLVYTTAVKAGTYTVYHVQQKTTGGKAVADYVLEATDTNKVVAENSTLEDLKNSYTGFTAKALAQNETVLYVFYDRNKINYTFQTGSEGRLNDGTTERSVEGLYGANVPLPIASSSTHNFGGWFISTNDPLPATFGEEDLIFSARWTEKAAGGFSWYETPVDAETGNAANSESKYIYFGVFPKTVLEEGGAIAVDETEMKVMGANTYYKGNDGNYYAKVSANPYGSNYKYSDETKIESGKARYFKVEPIKWKLLTADYNNTGKALLLAEDIVTANVPYYVDDAWTNREIDGTTVYPNNYKYSTIRAYLNGKFEEDDTQEKTSYEDKGFLQTAFTSNARFLIADTVVNNSKETTGYNDETYTEEYACEKTEDKIFLLSESEVINSDYGFEGVWSSGVGNARIRITTDYAKANYANQSKTDGYGGWWWLRSPVNSNNYNVHCVRNDGYACDYSYVHYPNGGVVPALCISLQ